MGHFLAQATPTEPLSMNFTVPLRIVAESKLNGIDIIVMFQLRTDNYRGILHNVVFCSVYRF